MPRTEPHNKFSSRFRRLKYQHPGWLFTGSVFVLVLGGGGAAIALKAMKEHAVTNQDVWDNALAAALIVLVSLVVAAAMLGIYHSSESLRQHFDHKRLASASRAERKEP